MGSGGRAWKHSHFKSPMTKTHSASQKNPTKAATKELSNNATSLLFSMTAAKAGWAVRALLSKGTKES
jgi:hypothetical protein